MEMLPLINEGMLWSGIIEALKNLIPAFLQPEVITSSLILIVVGLVLRKLKA